MHRKHRQGGDRPRRLHGHAPERAPRRHGQAHDEGGEDGGADQAELAQRLDVERVRVLGRVEHGALAQPVDPERARPGAANRVVAELLEGDPPVVVAVGLDRGQARGRGADLGRARALLERRRAQRGREQEHDAAGDDQARAGQAHAPRAQAPGGLAAAEPEAAASRRGHEHKEQHEHRRALGVRVAALERAHRGQQAGRHRRDDAEGDEQADHPHLPALGRQRQQHHEPDRQRGQRAPRERQVDPHRERRGDGGGDEAQAPVAAGVARHASREHEAHGRERAHRVPVRQRLLEPPERCVRVGEVDHAGQQAPREPVADDDEGAEGQRGLHPARRRPRAEQRRGSDQRAQVERHPLEIVLGGACERRPVQRERDPTRERGQRGDGENAGPPPRKRPLGHDCRDDDERPGRDAADLPRLVEVAAGEEGDDRRPGEQSAGGEGADGIHDGGASAAAAARSSASVRVCAVGPVSRRARRSEGRSITYQLTAAIPSEAASAIRVNSGTPSVSSTPPSWSLSITARCQRKKP